MNRIVKKAIDYEYQSIEEYKNDFYYLFSKIINEYGEKSLFYKLETLSWYHDSYEKFLNSKLKKKNSLIKK